MRHLPRLALLLAACGAPQQGAPASGDDQPTVDAPVSTTDPDGDVTPPTGVDPAGDGSFTVESTIKSITLPNSHVAPATIYVPNSPAPRPLVVISPGFQMVRTQYASYAHHLATWGMTVVLADYTDTGFFADHQGLADDVRAVITWAIGQPTLGVDAAKIVTAGHSLGGDISMLVAADDARVKAVIGWDPVDASSPSVTPEKMPNMHAAVAVIGETTNSGGGGMPCAPAAENFQKFYAAAMSPALQMTVTGADHMDWVDDSSCGFCGFCAAGTAPDARAHDATRRLNVAWLRLVLEGDTSMNPWLAAPANTAVVRK